MNWRKSTYSGGNGGSCVEVGQAGRVLIRDTKDRGGPMLAVSPATWRELVDRLKAS
jgi:Domain of unknown function (DUF397)